MNNKIENKFYVISDAVYYAMCHNIGFDAMDYHHPFFFNLRDHSKICDVEIEFN